MNHEPFIVPPGKKIRLRDYDPNYTANFTSKDEALLKLQEDVRRLAKYQDVLYAQNTYALLIIFQAMDAAGKDGAIKHVMSGINPQGCQVFSFKSPSSEELDHDYLWRTHKALPERGRIGIFNRSYYEEVLVVRVHQEILNLQQLPPEAKDKNIWKRRFTDINDFEHYLVNNGIVVIKFFLNVSKEEQKRRFLKRIMTPEKNWKFSLGDAKERGFWEQYMEAYEDMFNHTSTAHAPWHIIPADHKWFTRAAVADVVISKLKSLKLSYPTVSEEHRQNLLKAKEVLENEDRQQP
ncbi:MAG: polyphosphate kinase 2 family protein [Pyrinomonadaceae bacterium]|nr:polyphosphate kinase 2 family protein [Pyrinomonadaceae bacterium]